MLDTNTASYVIKGHPAIVRERLKAEPMHTICISVITEAELLLGVAKQPKSKQLALAVDEFLKRVTVLDWDSDVAATYAKLHAQCETKGKILSCMDMLIAAHAIDTLSLLVTSDKAFNQVKDWLTIIDWTKKRQINIDKGCQ